jgi:CheY-like chemotaxis protein
MSRILVVEDDQSVAAVIRYHLESAGFQSLLCGDVEAAWTSLVSNSPHAAVVDIRLPGADGWTLLDRIRGDARFSELPVVVLTGMLEPETVDKARSLGCEYLSKPFSAGALLDKIKRHAVAGDSAAATPLRSVPDPPPAPDAPKRVPLVEMEVVLLLEGYRVEGKVHLPPELARFSEAWEALLKDHRGFLPLTDAKAMDRDGRVMASARFMEIAKQGIRAVFPIVEEADS